eukprot:2136252-Prymnesium_polylepis.1
MALPMPPSHPPPSLPPSNPPPVPPSYPALVYGFETPSLETGWTTGRSGFSWSCRGGSTPSSSTGPSSALGGSYYMYTEVSSPRSAGDLFDMSFSCPTINSSFVQLSWWYHMYGSTIGSLRLRDSSAGRVRWTRSGNQGNAWRFAQAALPGRAFTFEGVRGSSYTGDIALDQVTVVCRESPLPPSPPPAPPLAPGSLCLDVCAFAGDSTCDDGGVGSDNSNCALGTDCTDCGYRTGPSCVDAVYTTFLLYAGGPAANCSDL